jgi:hypothetical protein
LSPKPAAGSTEFDTLEIVTTPNEQFEEVTMAGIDEGKRLGYNPTRYLQMVKQYGAVGAAKRVLRPGPPSEGFVTLAYLKDRKDLTTEATAVQPQFQELFTDEELRIARERLGE